MVTSCLLQGLSVARSASMSRLAILDTSGFMTKRKMIIQPRKKAMPTQRNIMENWP